MAKRLFLLLICSFIGIVNAPSFLMATDAVELSNVDASKVVETVILPEPTPEPTPAPSSEPITSRTTTATEATAIATTAAPVNPTTPAQADPLATNTVTNAIVITGRVIPIVEVGDATVDSGNHVNKYGDKFLYGHNSANVFGALSNLSTGQTFTVSLNGTSTNYQIAKIVIYEKNRETGQLQLNGSGNYMRAVANARSEGISYDLSIMTCYGTAYDNGDASHRLVIFANAI